MNLVTLENVSKQYSERLLLDGVHLRINEGNRIGLIGVNGSGKTTLLRIIAGEEQADSGTVTLWGGVRVEYLPQNPQLEGRADRFGLSLQRPITSIASLTRLSTCQSSIFSKSPPALSGKSDWPP